MEREQKILVDTISKPRSFELWNGIILDVRKENTKVALRHLAVTTSQSQIVTNIGLTQACRHASKCKQHVRLEKKTKKYVWQQAPKVPDTKRRIGPDLTAMEVEPMARNYGSP